MKPFTMMRSIAAAMPQANIDTDQVIPARLMRRPRTMPEGYAPYLFHDMRRIAGDALDPAFPFNARSTTARRSLLPAATSAAARPVRRRSMRWSIRAFAA